MKLNYKFNKTIFRIVFLIMLLYVLLVHFTNDIYSYNDLKGRQYIKCIESNQTIIRLNEQTCLNPYYNPFCFKQNDNDSSCDEFIRLNTCIDTKGFYINCLDIELNIFYKTSYKMIFCLLLFGFMLNDFYNLWFIKYGEK
jgi:hypothetical protein